MAKRRIFSVGFELPGAEFEYLDFDSDQTLLDADIVLFEPTLEGFSTITYNGKPLLDEHDSFAMHERMRHWRTEIAAAVAAGKLVIVYLVKPNEYFRYTGQQKFSGTGRGRTTTNIVTETSSYDAVPNVTKVVSTSGSGLAPIFDTNS